MTEKIDKLTSIQKILLSIFPVLAFLFFIDTILFLSIPYEVYFKAWLILFALMIIQTIVLLPRIYRKQMPTKTKTMYIVLSISIVLFQLYYVWHLDEKYHLR